MKKQNVVAALDERYSELIKKENVANQCVGFWAFNFIFGDFGKDLEYVTPVEIVTALMTRDISVSEELAQCIIDLWVVRGMIVLTAEGYKKLSLKSA